jgi:hypothetical protein
MRELMTVKIPSGHTDELVMKLVDDSATKKCSIVLTLQGEGLEKAVELDGTMALAILKMSKLEQIDPRKPSGAKVKSGFAAT